MYNFVLNYFKLQDSTMKYSVVLEFFELFDISRYNNEIHSSTLSSLNVLTLQDTTMIYSVVP